MANLMIVTFAVPTGDEFLTDLVVDDWLRVDDTIIIMMKNEWLAKKDTMQPHSAEVLGIQLIPPDML